MHPSKWIQFPLILKGLCWIVAVLWIVSSNSAVARVEGLFDTNRILEVEITLAPADWKVLRYQHRESDFFPEPGTTPGTNAYSWFPAQVRIDGRTFPVAQVRKKGYIGSNDTKKPSLKVRIGGTAKARSDGPALDLTLNNNNQDPALVRQSLAYDVFRRAGVPAPRCNFARVTVNGVMLGLFTHVEGIKKPFLQRNFGRADGSLYEGGRSDFRSGWFENFEIKNDGEVKPRADLERATKAIEAAPSLLPVLAQYIDLDVFLRFWAVESLLDDADGYASNANNYFLYHHPVTDKFIFIPWGPDRVMYSRGAGGRSPNSVIAVGILAHRLYSAPEGRERYRETLRLVLRDAWNEAATLSEVDRLEALLTPALGAESADFKGNLDRLRHFIKTRRSQVEPELDGPAPELKSQPLELAKRTNVGHFEGTFSTRNGPIGPSEPTGLATLSGTVYGQKTRFAKTVSQAGVLGDGSRGFRPTLVIMGSGAETNRSYLIFFSIDPELYAPGAVLPVNNTHVFGTLLETDDQWRATKMIGMLRGSLHLRAASTNETGTIEGDVKVDIFSKLPRL